MPKKLQEKLPTKMPGTKKKTQTGDGADDPVKVGLSTQIKRRENAKMYHTTLLYSTR